MHAGLEIKLLSHFILGAQKEETEVVKDITVHIFQPVIFSLSFLLSIISSARNLWFSDFVYI